MNNKNYNCCTSDFDIKKHKKTYVNYFEAIILSTGKVVYAIPSHVVKLEKLAAEKLKISLEQLRNNCPKKYAWDYLIWLMNITKAIAIWNDFYLKGELPLTQKQINKLKILKMNGIYCGSLKI